MPLSTVSRPPVSTRSVCFSPSDISATNLYGTWGSALQPSATAFADSEMHSNEVLPVT